MEELFGANGQASEWADQAIALIMAYAPKVLLAIVTLIIGLWLINRFVRVLDNRLGKKDPTLNKFLCGLISAILKILLLISVASMVGIATTSFVAIIGAAGLAVGLALQGSLANFAGGVLILIFKPFKVGDVIDAQGFLGSVREITILYTIVDTFDNRRIVIPNGQLSNASLTNLSAYETRRCDMSFGIGYGELQTDMRETVTNAFDLDGLESVFVYNAMVGGRIPITDVVELSLGYRYIATTETDEARVTILGITQNLEAEFDAHEVSAGVRFLF